MDSPEFPGSLCVSAPGLAMGVSPPGQEGRQVQGEGQWGGLASLHLCEVAPACSELDSENFKWGATGAQYNPPSRVRLMLNLTANGPKCQTPLPEEPPTEPAEGPDNKASPWPCLALSQNSVPSLITFIINRNLALPRKS